MNILKRIYRFIRFNQHKMLTIQVWIYSAIFRFQMLYRDTKKLNAKWGKEGLESPNEVTHEQHLYAIKVAYAVDQVCGRTKWESKCLVRALSAQKLLKKKKIPSTLYLGCGLDDDGKMIAHAWLRCGRYYVSGGNGMGYAVVDKFST